MNPAPAPSDIALFVALTLISALLDWRWLYPALERASAAGTPGVRVRFYSLGIAWEWVFTAAVIALWLAHGRPWSALWLAPPTTLRAVASLVVAAGGVTMIWMQHRGLVAGDMSRARRHLTGAEAMLPRTSSERVGFAALSVTAGICEEILFRGFVPWVLAAWVGPVPACVLGSLLFGFAHYYLGQDAAIRAAIAGALFTCVVVLTGSLLPAIVIHAAADLSAGEIGFRMFTRDIGQESQPAAPAEA